MSDASKLPETSNDLSEARAETMRRATEIAVRIGLLANMVGLLLLLLLWRSLARDEETLCARAQAAGETVTQNDVV